MPKRSRRNHAPAFKAKVVLAAVRNAGARQLSESEEATVIAIPDVVSSSGRAMVWPGADDVLRTCKRQLINGLIALLLAPSCVLAQGTSIGAVALSAKHRLLGDVLTGAAVSISRPRRDQRSMLRLDLERVRGRADRVGVACAGLIEPGTCQQPESLVDESRLTIASGGVGVRVLHWKQAWIAYSAGLALASVQSETRGRSSGRFLSAKKLLWGGEVGGNAAWTPSARVPVAVEVHGGIGGLVPVLRTQMLDGYAPFEGSFVVTRLRLGLVWRPPRW